MEFAHLQNWLQLAPAIFIIIIITSPSPLSHIMYVTSKKKLLPKEKNHPVFPIQSLLPLQHIAFS